ncbi:hypothetical protein [Parabacteroides johnsonii]
MITSNIDLLMSCISPPAILVPVQRAFVPCCNLALQCPVAPVRKG